MLPFRHILFPVDYSEPCLAIIPYVTEMTKRFSATLTLVHAYGLGLEALGYNELSYTDHHWPDEARASEERRLRDFACEMFPGQHLESLIESGDAASVIRRVVQHQGADLVMLPT